MVQDQSPELRIKFQSAIEQTKKALEAGKRPSTVVQSLHREGIGALELIFILREATGASLSDLKTFGLWWSREHGVVDPDAFDEHARDAFAGEDSP